MQGGKNKGKASASAIVEEKEEKERDEAKQDLGGKAADDDTDYSFASRIDKCPKIDRSLLDIKGVVDSGATSSVSKAFYNSMTIPVAVKIINVHTNYKLRKLFEREVIMLTSVKHDNIVTLVGVSDEDEDVDPMIVTEFVEGGTLKEYLKSVQNQSPDLKLAMSFALDICRAMEYLHGKHIIHRDLKPGNLLVSGKEDKRHIKVVDFGLATIRKQDSMEKLASDVGTIPYMAPEVYGSGASKRYYTRKADVFSFSIVLWQLLTNKIPFEGIKTRKEVANAVLNKKRPSVEELKIFDDQLRREFAHLLKLCWSEYPHQRLEFNEITDTLTRLFNKHFPTVNVMEESMDCAANKSEHIDDDELGKAKTKGEKN